MGGVLLGFALGAMAFTAQGRELGNKLGDVAMTQARKVMDGAAKSTEQPSGASGNHRDPG